MVQHGWISVVGAPADGYVGALVLLPESSSLRRAVGPMSWAALEVLASRARTVGGELVSEIGVRALAVELGVAKDTAARALVVLRTHGVLAADQRRNAHGRFGTASYTIVAGSRVFRFERSTNESSAHEPVRRRQPPATQLSLLPAD
jgi:hypothetical protein